MNNEDKNKKGNTGCFIITFLMIAAGIPAALAQEKEGPIGSIVIVIFGIAVAWSVAKAISNSN